MCCPSMLALRQVCMLQTGFVAVSRQWMWAGPVPRSSSSGDTSSSSGRSPSSPSSPPPVPFCTPERHTSGMFTALQLRKSYQERIGFTANELLKTFNISTKCFIDANFEMERNSEAEVILLSRVLLLAKRWCTPLRYWWRPNSHRPFLRW